MVTGFSRSLGLPVINRHCRLKSLSPDDSFSRAETPNEEKGDEENAVMVNTSSNGHP